MLFNSPEEQRLEDEEQMKYLSEWNEKRKKKRRKPISNYPTMLDVFICIMLFIIFLLTVTFSPHIAAWIVK